MSGRRARVYWACQAAGWGAWTLMNQVLMAARPGADSWRTLSISLWLGATGLLGSHLLREVIRRRGWLGLSPAALLFRLLAAILAHAALLTVVNLLAMIYLFGVFGWADTRWTGYLYSGAIWSIMFVCWTSIYTSVHYVERHRRSELDRLRLELSAREAQLGVLRAQLNPHFIFNCLNSIRALVGEDPSRAQSAITELASLLRQSLQSDRTPLVALRQEMETVEDYLKLEALRYEDRLRVTREIDPACLDRRVPPMLVQGLVENAIKHGIAKRTGGGALRVQAACEDGHLVLRVHNSGVLQADGSGTGLENARRRLEILFGPRASLSLRAPREGEVVAEVRLPEAEAPA